MIRLNGLSAGYGRQDILEPVDLAIPDSSLTIVIGPNGSGKSTLLKTIAGILPPLSGEVILRDNFQRSEDVSDQPDSSSSPDHSNRPEDDRRLNSLPPTQRAQLIAYLPQNRNTPEISAFRMVLHGRFPYLGWPRRYRECDRKAAEEAMKRTDCWEFRNRRLPDLSGGERQKVYLAMILAQDTPNILLDEPTTWLDIGHQLNLMQTAAELASEKKCVVMVLHDLSLAFRYADRLILIHDHQVSALMTPEELFNSHLADAAFGIRLSRFMTDSGWQYYYQ